MLFGLKEEDIGQISYGKNTQKNVGDVVGWSGGYRRINVMTL